MYTCVHTENAMYMYMHMKTCVPWTQTCSIHNYTCTWDNTQVSKQCMWSGLTIVMEMASGDEGGSFSSPIPWRLMWTLHTVCVCVCGETTIKLCHQFMYIQQSPHGSHWFPVAPTRERSLYLLPYTTSKEIIHVHSIARFKITNSCILVLFCQACLC